MDLIARYNNTNIFGQSNNLSLKVIEQGKIEYRMQLKDEHFALPEVIHGGAIAGLMDAVLSVAALSSVADEGQYVSTVEFKINYLRSVNKKMELLGVGQVINKGKKLIIANGEIFDEDKKLVAIGLGTMIPVIPRT